MIIFLNLFFQLAVLQQNLSAVHEIWKECTKCYNLSLVALRRFIWSFTRLGDLKSAYEALQQMVSLAIHRKFTVSKNAQGKLFTSRLDIPIPSSNTDLGLKGFSMANETSVPCVFENCEEMEKFANFGIMPKTQLSGSVTKVLRWSFNDVIHACAQTQNCGLSEKLVLQVPLLLVYLNLIFVFVITYRPSLLNHHMSFKLKIFFFGVDAKSWCGTIVQYI